MKKPFLLVVLFISISGLAQPDYDELSDKDLQLKLSKELALLEANGADYKIIFDTFLVETDKYILSRVAYYRFDVFTKNISERYLDIKMKQGTLENNDVDTAEKIIKRNKTYQEYLDYKKTDEAKETWENSTHDGILKLVVNDIERLTEAEQKRYDGLVLLLNKDEYFKSFVITDGVNYKTIQKIKVYNND